MKVGGLLLAAIISVSSAAAAEVPLRYAYPDQSIWTARVGPDGATDNPLLRLADQLFKKAGLKWSAQAQPASRVFESLRNGEADFSMLVKSPALDECCIVGPQPVASTKLRLYSSAQTAPAPSIHDLRGKSVIVVRGYTYGAIGKTLRDPASGVNLEIADTHQAAFAMLRSGRAPYLLDYAGPAAEVLSGMGDFKARHADWGDLDVYLVMSRTRRDAAAMLTFLESVMSGIDRKAVLNLPSID